MPRRDVGSTAKGYRKHPGMIAWLFHRITGVLLVLYFIAHMLDSSAGIEFFNAIAKNIYVEAVIVIAFAWHAANGLRIIFMEFFSAAERSCFKKGLVIFSVLALLMALVGLYYVKAYIDQEAQSQVEETESSSIESVITNHNDLALNTTSGSVIAKGE